MAWFDLMCLQLSSISHFVYWRWMVMIRSSRPQTEGCSETQRTSMEQLRSHPAGGALPHHVSLLQTLEDLLWRGKQEMTDLSCDFKCWIKSSEGQSVCVGFCSRHSRPRPRRQILVWSHSPSDSGLRTRPQVSLCFSDLWRPEPSRCQGRVPSAVRAAQTDETVSVCVWVAAKVFKHHQSESTQREYLFWRALWE